MGALLWQVLVGELAALLAHCDHSVPARPGGWFIRGWLAAKHMVSDTNRGRGEANLPPPVRVVEVTAVVDHAEGVVEGRVDQPAAGAVGGHTLQALCTCRTHTQRV